MALLLKCISNYCKTPCCCPRPIAKSHQQSLFKSCAVSLPLVFFLLFLLSHPQPGQTALQHVQLIFRHGERTPTNYLTFPSEHKSAPAGMEVGEMTNNGRWQEYLLGQRLRKQYGPLLGNSYHPREINVFSGRDNRTVESALLVLAGLFPPSGAQLWNARLAWQPIPVETVEVLDHVSFGMFDRCEREKERLLNSEQYKRLGKRFAADMALLSEQTGLKIGDLDTLQKVLDAIVTRAGLPSALLPIPDWLARNGTYLTQLKKRRLEMHEAVVDMFIAGQGGWHLDQLVGRMDDRVANRSDQRMVLYSAHDANFLTLGRFLNVSVINDLFPDYASLLAIELHDSSDEQKPRQKEEDEHFVRLFFRDGLNGTNRQLAIAGCGPPCPLSVFRTLQPRVTTAQWMFQCRGMPPGLPAECCPSSSSLLASLTAVLLILVLLLLGFLCSLLWSCRSYKQRYERLLANESERSPLLLLSDSDTDEWRRRKKNIDQQQRQFGN